MSKKLIFMIRSEGKSNEQLGREIWSAWVKYVATELNLSHCQKCGEYRNPAKNILCICDGIVCTKCHQNKTRRPISDHFNERDAKVWHNPWFASVCNGCRTIEREDGF